MYLEIRNLIKKNKILFLCARIIYSPIRIIKEKYRRSKMANIIVENYCNCVKEDRKIIYIGIPEHNNLGDIGQTYCTLKWIEENYPDYMVIKIKTRAAFDKKIISFLHQKLNDNDIIIFQSGYCTRDKNPDHEIHKFIAGKFPNAKIVLLPQTVNLKSDKEIETVKNIFSKCNKSLFICRDYTSLEQARLFIDDFKLDCYPDVVTTLIGRFGIKNKSRRGVMLCIRDDDEKFYSTNKIVELSTKLKSVFSSVVLTDTNSSEDASTIYTHLENAIRCKINEFSNYEVVITDRFHGTIFSLIANTPVIVIKTNDHKVTSGVTWFDGIFDTVAVQAVDNLEDAYLLAKKIHDDKPVLNNTDYFYQNYYKEKLISRIEQL